MPYIYRVSRREPVRAEVTATEPPAVVEVTEVVDEAPTYRDLQATAKALDIPANQTADDLKKAISEADDG